jgi:hypothetical protein
MSESDFIGDDNSGTVDSMADVFTNSNVWLQLLLYTHIVIVDVLDVCLDNVALLCEWNECVVALDDG